MARRTPEKRRAFWIQVMEKLNASEDLYHPIPEVIKDLCDFFDFGGGFIYQADHTATFFLRECYSVYYNEYLHKTIDIGAALGAELTEQLVHTKAVIFKQRKTKNELERRLSELFHADLMVLIPISDENLRLSAFTGIIDRRGSTRTQDEDFKYVYAVLSSVANHIRLQLYRQRVDSFQQALESMLDSMGIDVYVNDFHTREILYANRSMAAPYGGVDALLGKPCWQALYDDKQGPCDYCPQDKLVDGNGEPVGVYSWDYRRPFDGSWFRVFNSAFKWIDGRIAHVVSSVDITENKRNEQLIREMAEKDTLTGLPNRRKLLADCDEDIERMRRTGGSGYMLFLDLDGFKSVNDTLGHQAGDELLVKVGELFQSHPLTAGNSYRNGGDEFVLLLTDCSPRRLRDTLGFLLDSMAKPWELKDGAVGCPASIGVARYPFAGETTDSLIRRADIAMYASKRDGKGLARICDDGRIVTPEEYFGDLES